MLTSGLNEQVPDADLWRSVCEGSVPAFETVVQRYQSLVCAVAYNACGDLALSEDVAQEAFWSAWRERASLAEPGRLRAWLYGIARNLGHNARRRVTRALPTAPLEAAASVPTGGPGPVDTVASREEECLVWRALEQIPESYREPLILFYREDQSVAEVASTLDLSPDAAKKRLSRGREMLQEQVAKLVEGTLRRSRPGRPFTVGVVTGLATLTVGAKTALAGTGAAQAAAPFATVTGAGLTGALVGPVVGSLGGLFGGWLGTWLPAQVAPTKPEREHLLRTGKRTLVLSILFTVILLVPTIALAGRLSPVVSGVLLGAWLAVLSAYVTVEFVCMTRKVRRLRSEAAAAEPNDTPLRAGLEAFASRYRGRVFRSRATFLGLPLVDVNVSDPAPVSSPNPRRVARGWIAIGDDAYGVLFAFGGRAFGLIACGGLAVGLVAVGGGALGAFALGGGAAGIVAFGGIGLGWQACGGVALAWDVACGGVGVAWHAAYGGLAIAYHHAVHGPAWAQFVTWDAARASDAGQPLVEAVEWYAANVSWIAATAALTSLLACGAAMLMYRREPAR
jgi:RNA polymerase sigma factor (sigma-70 family)